VPLFEVTGHQVIKFMWQNIMCRFGFSHTIIFDNETNFTSKEVATLCAKYKFVHRFSTPYYPQGNDQAEISNRIILDSLYKSLAKAKGKWVEQLLGVLWVYRTTKRIPTGETLFSLAYWTEAIIPVDICMLMLRTEGVDLDQNAAQLWLVQDYSEGRRRQAMI